MFRYGRAFILSGWIGIAACSQGGSEARGHEAARNDSEDTAAPRRDASKGERRPMATAALPGAVVAAKADPGRCPIVRSEEWRAAVATSGDGARTLLVGGYVVTNTSGYQVRLEQRTLDKARPPNQHFELIVREPTGIVLQVETRHPVYGTAPGQLAYASVVISCRGEQIARITDIEQYPDITVEPVRP